MKTSQILLLLGLICLAPISATVFEAERSEDVDLFLDENQKETCALLFYDSEAENTDTEGWFSALSSKVLGIFMSQDQYGRSTEDWVEMFDDKLHLMRVDVRSPDLMRTREEFNIEEDLPFIVIRDKQRTVLRELVNEDTYEHVRDLLDKRPNILHKTGGAALKSFSLEPDSEAVDTAPRVIQYFDLEEGEPTNVEEPIQRQYVNWGATDVIGPDGQWMERGRNWVTSYEIPESGIKNQESKQRISIKDRIKDDPRRPAPRPTQPRPAQAAPTQGPKPTQAAPAQARPAQAAPAQAPRPVQSAKPTQAAPTQGARPTQTTRPAQTTQAKPTATRPAPTASQQAGAKPTTQAKPAAAPTARSSTPVTTSNDNGPQKHRYHDRGYTGYNRGPYRGRF